MVLVFVPDLPDAEELVFLPAEVVFLDGVLVDFDVFAMICMCLNDLEVHYYQFNEWVEKERDPYNATRMSTRSFR